MGVICLGVAVLMVVWGQFFLPQSIAPELQLAFWLLCFLLTLSAIVIACMDLLVLRQRTRAEKRELFEETMHEIEQEARRSAMSR
jgi:hypothetical protein